MSGTSYKVNHVSTWQLARNPTINSSLETCLCHIIHVDKLSLRSNRSEHRAGKKGEDQDGLCWSQQGREQHLSGKTDQKRVLLVLPLSPPKENLIRDL